LRQLRSSVSFKSLPVIVHSSRVFSREEEKELSDSDAFLYPKQAYKSEGGATGLLQVLHDAGIRA
jgi:hypothetical protein